MIKYEDYLDRCFTLASSQQGVSFIRSQFDYGVRQRRAVRGYSTHNVRIVMRSMHEVQIFKQFWEDLNLGADKFLTDQVIHDDISREKTIRFTNVFSLQQMGADRFIVTCVVELVKSGIGVNDCPLVPSNHLVPHDGLVLCG